MTVTAFLRDHIRAAAVEHDVTVVVNTPPADMLGADPPAARVQHVPIERPIRPQADLRALWQLFRLFRRERFDLVHSVTPKAGLLAALAGRLAGVPLRLHTFTGQVWATRSGMARDILRGTDRLLAALLSTVLADSRSQLAFLEAEGVVRRGRGRVLASGSICGVDTQRFRPDATVRSVMRADLGVPEDAVLLLFIGRINRDKGVADLAQACAELAPRYTQLYLALVGTDEDGLAARVAAQLAPLLGDRLILREFTSTPERYLMAADVLCLPSYREGFGSVIIEAAACGVPAIASRIYGVTDAIVEGETGLLHDAANVAQLRAGLERLLSDAPLRQALGAAALARAQAAFPAARVTVALIDLYRELLDTPQARAIRAETPR